MSIISALLTLWAFNSYMNTTVIMTHVRMAIDKAIGRTITIMFALLVIISWPVIRNNTFLGVSMRVLATLRQFIIQIQHAKMFSLRIQFINVR